MSFLLLDVTHTVSITVMQQHPALGRAGEQRWHADLAAAPTLLAANLAHLQQPLPHKLNPQSSRK